MITKEASSEARSAVPELFFYFGAGTKATPEQAAIVFGAAVSMLARRERVPIDTVREFGEQWEPPLQVFDSDGLERLQINAETRPLYTQAEWAGASVKGSDVLTAFVTQHLPEVYPFVQAPEA